MSAPHLADSYAPLTKVIETDLAHELILLDPVTQEMFSLNDTGRAIWQSLQGRTVHGVATELSQRFEITLDSAETEVRSLVSQLLDAKLIAPAGEPGQ